MYLYLVSFLLVQGVPQRMAHVSSPWAKMRRIRGGNPVENPRQIPGEMHSLPIFCGCRTDMY